MPFRTDPCFLIKVVMYHWAGMNFFRLHIGCVALMVSLLVSACSASYKDVSNQAPFRDAIGQKFVVQTDLYIYKLYDSSVLELGPASDLGPYSIGVPRKVDDKYIGLKAEYLSLEGVVKRGQIFTIEKVLYRDDGFSSSISYRIALDGLPSLSKKQIATMQLIEPGGNLPSARNGYSPPIFKSEFVLPLESDGL